jgi:hypothetical protein
MTLRRYWFEFDISPGELAMYLSYVGLSYGCGVTAHSHDDAVKILHELLFGEDPTPAITRVTEDVDVATLDEGHVLPNMGDPSSRGIWFPAGVG